MPRSIWNGVITFGMVSIPVKLYTATENKDIAFHQLHKECGTRIKYQKYCPEDDRTVENDEIEKGYEYARGQYVTLTDEDFEQLPLPSKHSIQVSAFVPLEQIDPIYFEKSYYIEPDEAALRPFALFMKAADDMGVVAIAAITLRNKERLCALRTVDGTLVLDTLLYPDEVRIGENTAAPSVKVSEKELQMATKLIELMQQDFDPEQYQDHYREALKKVIEAKLDGKEIETLPEAPKTKVVDLMDALRSSVESMKSSGKPSLKSANSAAAKDIKEAREARARKSSRRRSAGGADKEEEKPKRRSRKTAAHTSKEKRTSSTKSRKRKASA